jgi:hypothetical protein
LWIFTVLQGNLIIQNGKIISKVFSGNIDPFYLRQTPQLLCILSGVMVLVECYCLLKLWDFVVSKLKGQKSLIKNE